MYKVIIGNDAFRDPGQDEQFYRNVVMTTDDSERLYGMLMFAINNHKSFKMMEEAEEIIFDDIEELKEDE